VHNRSLGMGSFAPCQDLRFSFGKLNQPRFA